MKRDGQDSVNSYLISLACCFINSMMFGMARISGILFVASISRFKIGRKQASFPYTFASFLRNFSGPFVGFLGHKFGVRAVTALGAVIGAVGASLCFFAENIILVTIFWGAVFGLGFGLGNILLPISINQHFDKHRATASGISFSGGCLGSFILPPIVEILLDNYGLSQTFLFLSGLILNCVPAALLLKKPNFKIQKEIVNDQEQTESENKISKIASHNTIENKCIKSELLQNCYSANSITPEITNPCQIYTSLSDEERIKRLSARTLLSDYSIHKSSSELLDLNQIIKKNIGNEKVDFKGERFSMSSSTYEKDNGFNKDAFPSNGQCEQKHSDFKCCCDLQCDYTFCYKKNDKPERNCNELYENYSYVADINEEQGIHKSPCDIRALHCCKRTALQDTGKELSNFNLLNQRYVETKKGPQETVKNTFHICIESTKTVECTNVKSEKKVGERFETPGSKKLSSFKTFSVIFEPMFLLIAITNAIYTSSFVCMVTIIVDFSRDLHIEASNEKYILMLLSVGDLTGRLGLGWITDHGYVTTPAFAAVCFAGQGLVIAAIVSSNSFISLAILVCLYGLTEAGLIIIFPVIMSQFIEADKQTVAISSFHFLSGPLCLTIAPLIGYFREEIGAYDWLFYGIAMLSAACSVCWIFAACVDKCRRKNMNHFISTKSA